MTVQTLAIVVLLVSFFVMIFLRFPIAYAVGLSSVLCLMVQGQALSDVCRLMVKGISSFSLMAVPFFITRSRRRKNETKKVFLFSIFNLFFVNQIRLKSSESFVQISVIQRITLIQIYR